MSNDGLPSGFDERLLKFINSEVSMIEDPIEVETDLLLTGAVDSLGVMSITWWLENEFGIQVDPTEITLDNFQTVEQTLRYCQTKLA